MLHDLKTRRPDRMPGSARRHRPSAPAKGHPPIMKAIIPAAGLGTRFLPSTKCTPKEMLPVLDKPVIQYVVEEALEPDEVDRRHRRDRAPTSPSSSATSSPTLALGAAPARPRQGAPTPTPWPAAGSHARGLPLPVQAQRPGPRHPLGRRRGGRRERSWCSSATTWCPPATSATKMLAVSRRPRRRLRHRRGRPAPPTRSRATASWPASAPASLPGCEGAARRRAGRGVARLRPRGEALDPVRPPRTSTSWAATS